MPDAMPGLPPRPIPLKDRSTLRFLERGQLNVIDGTFVVWMCAARAPSSPSAASPA